MVSVAMLFFPFRLISVMELGGGAKLLRSKLTLVSSGTTNLRCDTNAKGLTPSLTRFSASRTSVKSPGNCSSTLRSTSSCSSERLAMQPDMSRNWSTGKFIIMTHWIMASRSWNRLSLELFLMLRRFKLMLSFNKSQTPSVSHRFVLAMLSSSNVDRPHSRKMSADWESVKALSLRFRATRLPRLSKEMTASARIWK